MGRILRKLLLFIVFLSSPLLIFSQVHINEIMSSNLNGITDEDGAYSDWIELFNNSGSQANLNGFHISDDPANMKKWTFPDIALDPYSYLVVFASGKTM